MISRLDELKSMRASTEIGKFCKRITVSNPINFANVV